MKQLFPGKIHNRQQVEVVRLVLLLCPPAFQSLAITGYECFKRSQSLGSICILGFGSISVDFAETFQKDAEGFCLFLSCQILFAHCAAGFGAGASRDKTPF